MMNDDKCQYNYECRWEQEYWHWQFCIELWQRSSAKIEMNNRKEEKRQFENQHRGVEKCLQKHILTRFII